MTMATIIPPGFTVVSTSPSIKESLDMPDPRGSFFIPAAESYSSARADLFFGLRGASRFYNETVVPGIAGVRFVRQLSWSVMALGLAEQIKTPRVTSIANGIEALGSKLAWRSDPSNFPFRGKRAFNRDPYEWSFRKLGTRQGYVQVPYRMSTVRALPQGLGLGLALAGASRFNDMELSDIGRELAELTLQGRGRGNEKIGRFLLQWIKGDREMGNWNALTNALSPACPDNVERDIVLNCIKTVVKLPPGLPEDPDRRLRLVRFATQGPGTPFLSWLAGESPEHARQVTVAEYFEAYRRALLGLYAACTKELFTLESIGLSHLAVCPGVAGAFQILTDTARNYLKSASDCPHADAIRQAEHAAGADHPAFLKELVSLESRILCLVDGKVSRGGLYRNMLEEDSDDLENPDFENSDLEDAADDLPLALALFPHHRLTQFYSLLADCGLGGAL